MTTGAMKSAVNVFAEADPVDPQLLSPPIEDTSVWDPTMPVDMKTAQLLRHTKIKDPYAHYAGVGRYYVMLYHEGKGQTDMDIKMDGVTLPVHSGVMAAHSQHIANRLQRDKLPLNPSPDLSNQGITMSALKKAVCFCYTGTICVSIADLLHLLRVTGALRIDALSKLLEAYTIQISASPMYSLRCLSIVHQVSVKSHTVDAILNSAASLFPLSVSWPLCQTYFRNLSLLAAVSLLNHPEVKELGSRMIPFLAATEWMLANSESTSVAKHSVFNSVDFAAMSKENIVYCVNILQRAKLNSFVGALAKLLNDQQQLQP